MIICPFNRLIIKQHELENISPGGIVIPDKVKAKHPPRRGNVLHVGPDCKVVKVGDMVIFDDKAAFYDGIPDDTGKIEEYVFLKEEDVLAIERE